MTTPAAWVEALRSRPSIARAISSSRATCGSRRASSRSRGSSASAFSIETGLTPSIGISFESRSTWP